MRAFLPACLPRSQRRAPVVVHRSISLEDGVWGGGDDADGAAPVATAAAAAAAPLAPHASPSPSQIRGGFAADSPSRHTTSTPPFSPASASGSQPRPRQQQQASTPRSAGSARGNAAGSGGGRGRGLSLARPRPPPQREPANLLASAEAEVRHLTPAVLLLLRGLLLLRPSETFAGEASWVYPCLVDLVVVKSLEVRAAVRELLSARLAPLLRLPPRDVEEEA